MIIVRVTICTIFFVVASQKNPFLTLRKWKMIFQKIIWQHNLATLFPIPRYTYVSNTGTLSQTMAWKWPKLGHLAWNLYMFIDDRPFCEWFFWKVCKNSCLLFSLETSTHKGTPCQRIPFFEYFFTFFDFFEKIVKMAAMAIHWKGSNFSKLSMVLWYNLYLCILKWFLKKYQSKLSHSCSSNLNYFWKIGIKSFKWAKLGRKQENS